ncbi:hypothetical protein VNI00_008991 [Paramarasmius palmivorus]|uniref:DNL-type domain-containing protein n=1 Tax=Paramarasmius palmivorus TaxID=297713 RepID=A0AAW0CP04_9AGAR
MLPSRLYRNVGLPPPLRALITPHPSLPAQIKVQLRLRLGIINPAAAAASTLSSGATRPYSSTASAYSSKPGNAPASSGPAIGLGAGSSGSNEAGSSGLTSSQALPEAMEPKLQMTFTCTVTDCGTRSTHEFTKRSYERGIVIVQCPGCKNRHLIADHLGWFKESTEEGKLRTVEDLLRAKGEKVRRGKLGADGDIEIVE